MALKSEFSAGLSVCIGKFWENVDDNFSDFTVCVEDSQYRCHRFILGAVSEFFRALFRSGMQESEQNSVKLRNISSQTFELVLKAIYKSQDVLNNENIYEIWHTVNLLQIDYLIAECEKFVLNILSLNTYEKIYDNATMLDSKKVLNAVFDFIKLNFRACQKSETLLNMSINNALSIVESQELVVQSEDFVVEYILNWVQYQPSSTMSSALVDETTKIITKKKTEQELDDSSFSKTNTHLESKGISCATADDDKCMIQVLESESNDQSFPKERLKHLVPLLKAARLCLVSAHCLQMMFNHVILRSNDEARKMIFMSSIYQTMEDSQGQWPDRAVHRRCSDLVNVGICIEGTQTIRIFSFIDQLWYRFSCSSCVIRYEISCFNTAIHGFEQSNKRIYRFKGDNWETVLSGINIYEPNALFLLPAMKSLYIFNPSENKLYKTEQDYCLQLVTDYPFQNKIDHVASYRNTFLVFLTESITENILETAVYSFDLISKTWTRLNNLEGSAENMTVFSAEENTYILQNNGDLWRIITTPNNKPDFVFLSKLWDFKYQIYGAITYKGELFIVGEDLQVKPADKNWPEKTEQFTKIHVHGKVGVFSRFVPCIVRKSLLLKGSASTSL
ncbi:uncharacterized protein LOC131952320 [Physella acuta]|uniref:uncharacterized protein LOC131952320 n=1 Tax=Physella acuta TaxID=109671 RepID=UPI0027DC0F77|nr:uncharacterized protein LOC131952320 [Physella acuta]